jgi:hypothetical protein
LITSIHAPFSRTRRVRPWGDNHPHISLPVQWALAPSIDLLPSSDPDISSAMHHCMNHGRPASTPACLIYQLLSTRMFPHISCSAFQLPAKPLDSCKRCRYPGQKSSVRYYTCLLVVRLQLLRTSQRTFATYQSARSLKFMEWASSFRIISPHLKFVLENV